MFTIFRSSGLLALTLVLNSSSVFVSASNEGADRLSIMDYFQDPSSFEQFFTPVTPGLRRNQDAETCRVDFTVNLSPAAQGELWELMLEEMETSIVDFTKAPTFLAEIDDDCDSRGGEVFYLTSSTSCLSEIYPNKPNSFKDKFIALPNCLVGRCGSLEEIDNYVHSLPACLEAEVTNDSPLEGNMHDTTLDDIEDKLHHMITATA